jgi:hypothetical protein
MKGELNCSPFCWDEEWEVVRRIGGCSWQERLMHIPNVEMSGNKD